MHLVTATNYIGVLFCRSLLLATLDSTYTEAFITSVKNHDRSEISSSYRQHCQTAGRRANWHTTCYFATRLIIECCIEVESGACIRVLNRSRHIVHCPSQREHQGWTCASAFLKPRATSLAKTLASVCNAIPTRYNAGDGCSIPYEHLP